MRNAGTSDALITAVHRNGALVAMEHWLLRNSVTSFELPGTSYPGDGAILVTQEGTQIRFKVKVRRLILFRCNVSIFRLFSSIIIEKYIDILNINTEGRKVKKRIHFFTSLSIVSIF